MMAASNGMIEVIRYLVNQCHGDVNATNQDGDTALMKAVYNSKIEVVRYLAKECGVDVNTTSDDGETALMKATEYDRLEILRYLAAECGADVNVASKNGTTALIKASGYGRIQVVQYLAEECGADVNAQAKNGETAVMKAAAFGQIDVIRYLVEKCGADVHAKTTKGDTALRVAADRGFQDIQRILMPFVQLRPQANTLAAPAENTTISSIAPFIRPNEIEFTSFSQKGNIGGDFHAKWLDANVVVKLFIPDASHSVFDDEVRLWQQLRHPNVIKMYGACTAGPNLQFFVCEYASMRSLSELTNPARFTESTLWKRLHEAALGLSIFMSGDIFTAIFVVVTFWSAAMVQRSCRTLD
ncbi:hypothetical protein PC110_g12402 [Phytophthora cactorum]|uniref:Protein kinase domain-containing protein n=1 Tax=Phytophthora cactorum TaxID=29920 RepID=A0A329S6C5_9STRA|nr:hypothetical protein PC110_g12402 [Phytophthora cactorum]